MKKFRSFGAILLASALALGAPTAMAAPTTPEDTQPAAQPATATVTPAPFWNQDTCTVTIPNAPGVKYRPETRVRWISDPIPSWYSSGQKVSTTVGKKIAVAAFLDDDKVESPNYRLYPIAGWEWECGKGELKPAVLPKISGYSICGRDSYWYMFTGAMGVDPAIKVRPFLENMDAPVYTYSWITAKPQTGYYFRMQDQPDYWWLEDSSSQEKAVAQPNDQSQWIDLSYRACKKAPVTLPVSTTPHVSGTTNVGATLTANPGHWEPYGVNLRIQWLRNGSTIPGATSAKYKVTTADAGKSLAARVTGSAEHHATLSKVSTAKAIPLLSLTATPVPTVSGAAKVGDTLTASPGTWAPATVTLRYQWLRSGIAIAGATTKTYKVSKSDAGKKITVRVTGSKSGYKAVSKTSAAKSIALMNLTGTPTPTVSGTAKVGYTLTANPGTWSPSAVTLRYQWLRSGVAITGATAKTYKTTKSDAGKKITVKVTGSKTGYKTVSKVSAARSIALMSLTATPTPKILGTSKVGYTLKVSAGTWAPASVTLKYQWQRNGVNISTAAKSAYKLTTKDRGKKITVKVTGSKTGYKSVSKTSAYRLIK